MEKQVIRSRQNPLVKFVCGLSEKKKRVESGLFRFDGVKLLGEAIASGMTIKHVVYREDAEQRLCGLLECVSDVSVPVCAEVFDKISEERAPEGVITVAQMPRALHAYAEAEDIGESVGAGERLLIAESLRDPGNLGTVIRSCFALGIDKLVLSSDCADIYNPKTIRAAMGAIFRLPTVTVEADRLCDAVGALEAQGRRVFAAALDDRSVSITDMSLRAGDCFVIGNEGHGLSEKTVAACTSSVIIPMRAGAESLNAAAAAAICIWETVRAK